MKYIRAESRINDMVKKHLDLWVDVGNVNWSNPYEVDFETGEDYEDPNRIKFYYGDYSDDDDLFQWYGEDYFGYNTNLPYKENSPILEIADKELENKLNSMFKDKWYEPFKEWFRENFNVPVKAFANEIFKKY
jgi:hypothetical protein